MVASLLASGASAVSASAATAASRASAPTRLYYLALGDSVPVWNGTQSYPYRILAHYKPKSRGLALDDIAISGATTGVDAHRRPVSGSAAVPPPTPRPRRADHGRHRRQRRRILRQSTGVDERCAAQARATIKRNLGTMLAGLRGAAPHVPLLGMTYYNPFLGNWLAGGAARSITLATTPGLLALNRELTSLYGGPKKTADVQGAFKATDFTTKVASRWGTSRSPSTGRARGWTSSATRGRSRGSATIPTPPARPGSHRRSSGRSAFCAVTELRATRAEPFSHRERSNHA